MGNDRMLKLRWYAYAQAEAQASHEKFSLICFSCPFPASFLSSYSQISSGTFFLYLNSVGYKLFSA